jgi:hypothetical protein
MDSVAAFLWNQWQDSPGIGGIFRVEYADADNGHQAIGEYSVDGGLQVELFEFTHGWLAVSEAARLACGRSSPTAVGMYS